MRTKASLILIIIAALFLVSCTPSTVIAPVRTWDQLTPDQQARVVTYQFQSQVQNLFSIGKAYVAVRPETVPQWKTAIVPAFDVANTALKTFIDSKGSLSVDVVRAQLQPMINKILLLLAGLGVVEGV
jgi:hypothetical protein